MRRRYTHTSQRDPLLRVPLVRLLLAWLRTAPVDGEGGWGSLEKEEEEDAGDENEIEIDF